MAYTPLANFVGIPTGRLNFARRIAEGKYRPPTMEEIRANDIWDDLTEQQRKFVTTFVETNGDGVAAANAAYNASSQGSAQATANMLLYNNPRIRAILTLPHATLEEVADRPELCKLISARLRQQSLTVSDFLRLTALLMQLQPSLKPKQLPGPKVKPAEEAVDLDQIVLEAEKKQRHEE